MEFRKILLNIEWCKKFKVRFRQHAGVNTLKCLDMKKLARYRVSA